MNYRCEARSVEAFVQQLAVSYVARGYWFYVTGWIPEHKDPHEVDRKLVSLYGLELSKFERSRRKKARQASVHYLRHGRFYALVATRGKHFFFHDHGGRIQDIRRNGIAYGGYLVRYVNGRASVRLEQEEFKRLRAYFEDHAVRRRRVTLEEMFRRLPVVPYAPVRRQLFSILDAVNFRRKVAGYELVPLSCVPTRRRQLRVFVDECA